MVEVGSLSQDCPLGSFPRIGQSARGSPPATVPQHLQDLQNPSHLEEQPHPWLHSVRTPNTSLMVVMGVEMSIGQGVGVAVLQFMM